MADIQAPFLDGPIPGQSLTFEPGNRPWQNPPQYSTVEEALEYYIPRLVDPDLYSELINVIEMGVPLTTIANSLQVGGVMQGYHTIDVGVLIMPVLIEMMAYIAEADNIKYVLGTEEGRRVREKDSTIQLALSKLEAKMPEDIDVVEEQEEETEEPTGLMARRK